jgi:hypothetical protein
MRYFHSSSFGRTGEVFAWLVGPVAAPTGSTSVWVALGLPAARYELNGPQPKAGGPLRA